MPTFISLANISVHVTVKAWKKQAEWNPPQTGDRADSATPPTPRAVGNGFLELRTQTTQGGLPCPAVCQSTNKEWDSFLFYPSRYLLSWYSGKQRHTSHNSPPPKPKPFQERVGHHCQVSALFTELWVWMMWFFSPWGSSTLSPRECLEESIIHYYSKLFVLTVIT